MLAAVILKVFILLSLEVDVVNEVQRDDETHPRGLELQLTSPHLPRRVSQLIGPLFLCSRPFFPATAAVLCPQLGSGSGRGRGSAKRVCSVVFEG